MRKRYELTDPASCMSRAGEAEMTFVLLGRDAAAPVAIRAWIAERLRLGKNTPDDPQIVGAENCALTMEIERALRFGRDEPDPGPTTVVDPIPADYAAFAANVGADDEIHPDLVRRMIEARDGEPIDLPSAEANGGERP